MIKGKDSQPAESFFFLSAPSHILDFVWLPLLTYILENVWFLLTRHALSSQEREENKMKSSQVMGATPAHGTKQGLGAWESPGVQ